MRINLQSDYGGQVSTELFTYREAQIVIELFFPSNEFHKSTDIVKPEELSTAEGFSALMRKIRSFGLRGDGTGAGFSCLQYSKASKHIQENRFDDENHVTPRQTLLNFFEH